MKAPLTNIIEYTEATVLVPRLLADAVSSYITDHIVSGIILDESEHVNMIAIKFYVPVTENKDFRPAFNKYLSQICSDDMPCLPRISEATVASKDWEESYKKSIQPVLIGDDICVRPPWAKTPPGIKFDIIIEPKMAFGTGHHETTKTCLQLIHNNFTKGRRFLDFGCGTGVLSILADKMGAAFIKAIDYDITAVENCRENFGKNKVSSQYEILIGSFEKTANDRAYDMVCANLNKSDLIDNFALLKKLTGDNEFLILSGILENEQNEIERSIHNFKMSVVDCIHENEWLTYCLKK